MRLLPKEWEGTSPLFPKPSEGLGTSGASADILSVFAWGCTAGVIFGASRKTYRRIFWRRFPPQQFQTNNSIWGTIGACTTVSAVYLGGLHFIGRRLARAEASAILKEDGIAMPPSRLWEKTEKVTTDDVMVSLGAATAITTLALQKSRIARLSGWGILGQVSLSMLVGGFGTLLYGIKPYGPAAKQYQSDVLAASTAYTLRTGKPAPTFLYGKPKDSDVTKDPVDHSQQTLFPPQLAGRPMGTLIGLGSMQPLDPSESTNIVEPQPPGTKPHHCILLNGSLVYGPARDYFWEPESTESGIQALKEHVKDLNEKRTKLIQEAAFLFQEVSRRENKYLALDKTEHDTEAGRKSRKAMELLSSMHSNTYVEIAETDWLISDSKKMILQLETNGTWMPKSQGPPNPRVTEALLDKIKQHQKKTEFMLQQLELMVAPAEGQPQLDEDRREVKENTEATTDLVEYFEGMSKPR